MSEANGLCRLDGEEYPNGAELLRIINETIFCDRPDLQFRFDASAPPLIPAPPSS